MFTRAQYYTTGYALTGLYIHECNWPVRACVLIFQVYTLHFTFAMHEYYKCIM